MYASRHFWVVIAAGGIGRRMGASVPKQLLKLNNRTILENTVQVFRDIPEVDGIVVTAPEEALPAYRALFGRRDTAPGSGPAPAPAEPVPGVVPEPTGSSHRIHVIPGGGERQDSVRASLRFLSAQGARDEDIVLIHDGVRPYIGRDLVMRVADGVLRSGAATAAVPARYTMRDITEGTLDRSRLFEIQTPQGFTF
ncbi:2-C-methyl-D-erythritol 4-phosphate cytidylyltransferase, partial [uncultured Eubacterium sp.]|uniref:2-C-methyl-D-erythritol 4-phosphate cytidylyltransferase n=1 Tax=uncultured Eubacterium sp. TaxID=165185 RepID=UPI0025996CDA